MLTSWIAGMFLLVTTPAVIRESEGRYEISFGRSDTVYEGGWDRGRTGTQNEPVTRRLKSCADHGKIVE